MDGILWSVEASTRTCRVKIQGSNNQITAYYPENWQQTPAWLKPGNAVRIAFNRGIRGRIEVVGCGLIVPTPVAGGSAAPTAPTAVDAILTGCNLVPAYNDPDMVVLVKVGTYRIGGVTYTLDAIACNSDVYKASMGGVINTIAGALTVPASPAAGYFRFDLIQVGADGVLDYVAGTPFQTTPVYPVVSADHLQVGGEPTYIFLHSGTTEITSINIAGKFAAPVAKSLSVSLAPDHLHPADTTSVITITVLDQYGNAVSSSAPYVLTAEIYNEDNGTLTGDDGPGSTATRTGIFSSTTFTYTKGTTDFAIFKFALHVNIAIEAMASIICYPS
ncbi:MAG: hypothetical protein HPY65_07755 [Syntrophaceae bacterium]|nr:hypothetical protein [Syntrophaceae bacterium]